MSQLDFELEDGEYICPSCGQLFVPGISTKACPHDMNPETQRFVDEIQGMARSQKKTLAHKQALDILSDLEF